ncbi:MAG: hypothetical protein LM517_01510 [Nitrosomonas sp.]|nr:hypothetical protein [Nitrosomonas sp.]
MKNNNDLINAAFIDNTTGKLYFTCSCLAIVILTIDLVTPLGIAAGVAYVAVVLVSLKSPENRFTLITATACTVFVLLGYWGSPLSDALKYQVVANRALSIFAIWVTAILALKQRNKDHQLHQQHLQILQSLRDAEIQNEKLKVLKSTMLTVQHITGNFLNNLQYFQLEIERNQTLSADSSSKLNELIEDTANRLNQLGNIKEIREKKMAGNMTGIDYENPQ